MTKPIDADVDGTIHRLADRRAGPTDKTDGDGAGPGLGQRVRSPTQLNRETVSTPEFDADRVAGLRQAVSSGRYQVNSCSIAEKLLAMEGRLP
jgi:flagellar biosynthesis anti-sigma factor FlgM